MPDLSEIFESYSSKVAASFIGAASAVVGIITGFYATYQLITFIGA